MLLLLYYFSCSTNVGRRSHYGISARGRESERRRGEALFVLAFAQSGAELDEREDALC